MTHEVEMGRHFSRLAAHYNDLRTTDSEPVDLVADIVGRRQSLRAIDVGCGSGRYDRLLLEALPRIELVCCDINSDMLEQAARHLADAGLGSFQLQCSAADRFTAPPGGYDCILSFNAIHHFDPVAFLAHAGRSIKAGGRVFVYTRLSEQNSDTIWGRYFPGFIQRESRLYDRSQVANWPRFLGRRASMQIVEFRFPRQASLATLLERARNHHYSTFALYPELELRRAIVEFERRLRQEFDDVDRIQWQDGNVMIVLEVPA